MPDFVPGSPRTVALHRLEKKRAPLVARTLSLVRQAFASQLISFVVFGSVARGDATRGSDIDVLLVLNTRTSFSRRCERLADVVAALRDTVEARALRDEGYGTEIQFYPLSVQEADRFRMIYLDLVHDAVVLYDRTRFFAKLLARLRTYLAALGAQRIWRAGNWYWVLKPTLQFGETLRLAI